MYCVKRFYIKNDIDHQYQEFYNNIVSMVIGLFTIKENCYKIKVVKIKSV